MRASAEHNLAFKLSLAQIGDALAAMLALIHSFVTHLWGLSYAQALEKPGQHALFYHGNGGLNFSNICSPIRTGEWGT
eukprot:1158641-Pelagomonas_calceolata.AAC.3